MAGWTWAGWTWVLYARRFDLAALLGDARFAQLWIGAGLTSLLLPGLNRWLLSELDPEHGPGLLFLSLCAAATSALAFTALEQGLRRWPASLL